MNGKANIGMEKWRVQSPEKPGFHEVISPGSGACAQTWVFRLNLPTGESYRLESTSLEMNAALVDGAVRLSDHGVLRGQLRKLDSFYMPGGSAVTLTAEEDSVLYIAGAVCEGTGEPFVRAHDPNLPLGRIHQIHGEGVYARDVRMTLSDSDKASRLICGFTRSQEGMWTGWPPHQHEKDLEEVYCYFDMPLPRFGLQISYQNSGRTDEIVAHTVYSGTMVQIPAGYHPTVASPGTVNNYFWIMTALRHSSRSYSLAINDSVISNQAPRSGLSGT